MRHDAYMFGMLMLYAAYYGPSNFDDRFGKWESLRPRTGVVLFNPRPVRTVPYRVRAPAKGK